MRPRYLSSPSMPGAATARPPAPSWPPPRKTGAPFRLRVENLQEVLAPEDLMQAATGLSLEAGYNLILRRRWTVLLVPLLRLMHGAIRLRRRSLVCDRCAEHLETRPRPAAVVSVMPNFNGVIRDALAGGASRRALLGPPHRLRRLPAALLDRARARSGDRGDRPGGGPGAADRHPRRADRARLGNGAAPALLPDGGKEARERVRRELGLGRRLHGAAAVRRQGLARDGAALGAAARRRAPTSA